MFKKTLKTVLPVSAIALSFAMSAASATYVVGHPHHLTTVGSGILVFSADGQRTSTPACQTSDPNTWAVDTTTPTGQMEAAVILTAYSLHKLIYIDGTNNCDSRVATETLTLLQTYDQ